MHAISFLKTKHLLLTKVLREHSILFVIYYLLSRKSIIGRRKKFNFVSFVHLSSQFLLFILSNGLLKFNVLENRLLISWIGIKTTSPCNILGT